MTNVSLCYTPVAPDWRGKVKFVYYGKTFDQKGEVVVEEVEEEASEEQQSEEEWIRMVSEPEEEGKEIIEGGEDSEDVV